MVFVLYVDQRDVLSDKYGKRKSFSVVAEAQVENNLVVGIEVGHASDKKEEIDHRVVDTWNNPEVAIVDPIDSRLEEQLDLCSIVVGNCSEENFDTNCCDCDQMEENCHEIVVETDYNHLKFVSDSEERLLEKAGK